VARGLIARWVRARTPWPRPDLARPGTPRQRGLALLAGAGAAALLFTGWQAWELQGQRAQWQALADQAQERIAQVRRAAPPARTTRPEADGSTRAREAALRVVSELDVDWGAVLGSVEQATPKGVRWLALTHDARRGELRLEGQAEIQDAAFSVVDALARDRAWQDVALVHIGTEAAGGTAPAEAAAGARFIVGARRVAASAP
jgi:hypothetical protein